MKKNILFLASILICSLTSAQAAIPSINIPLSAPNHYKIDLKLDSNHILKASENVQDGLKSTSLLATQMGFVGVGLGISYYSLSLLKNLALKNQKDAQKTCFSDRTMGIFGGVGLLSGLGLIYFSSKLARI